MPMDLNGRPLNDNAQADAYGLRRQEQWTEGYTMMMQSRPAVRKRFNPTKQQVETFVYTALPLSVATVVSVVGGYAATALSVNFNPHWDYLMLPVASLIGVIICISRLRARDAVTASAAIFSLGLLFAHLALASRILHTDVHGVNATVNAIIAKMPAEHWWMVAFSLVLCIRDSVDRDGSKDKKSG